MTAMERYKNSPMKSYMPGILAIALILGVGQIIHPGFARASNLSSILNQAALLSIVCIGQMIVIVGTGGIDLSVGAGVTFGALVGSKLLLGNFSYLPLAIVGVLILGGIFGTINGVGITFFRIPALAMTLIMSTVIDGATKAITKGIPSVSLPTLFKTVFGKPIIGRFCSIILIVVVLITAFELILRKTNAGKAIYAVGSNYTAAKLCGLRVDFLSVLAYTLSGAMSCLAGLILVGYVGSGQLGMGDNYTMLSVAAVVIGGAKVTGGKGSLVGSVIGSVVLILLTTFMTSMGMPEGARNCIQGFILLAVMIANCRLPQFRQ